MLPKVLIAAVLVIVSVVFFLARGSFLHNNQGGADGTAQSQEMPDCPDPLILQTPIDIDKVTSILYPGQERGGDFKPHGGFRFDNSKNDEIIVKAPMDAVVLEGSRYIEEGEVQYMFDFQNSCGIRYRLDHLLVLTPKFAEIAEKLPPAKVDDSRTTHIEDGVSVAEGEAIATAVGFRKSSNVGVDFGVYNMRGKTSQDLRQNAICWFDLLPPEDTAKVKSLPPADSKSGSQSTLCKP